MKNKLIIICFVMIISLTGCSNKNDISAKSESLSSSISEKYVWTKINQAVKIAPLGLAKNNENLYYVTMFSFEPLCNDENIASIEYYAENCVGTFMDDNTTNPYAYEVVSTPYLRIGSKQDDIYFSLYYNLDTKMAHEQEIQIVGEIIEKIRIRLTVTYNDDSKKLRYFAIKLATSYNYRNLDMYEITQME